MTSSLSRRGLIGGASAGGLGIALTGHLPRRRRHPPVRRLRTARRRPRRPARAAEGLLVLDRLRVGRDRPGRRRHHARGPRRQRRLPGRPGRLRRRQQPRDRRQRGARRAAAAGPHLRPRRPGGTTSIEVDRHGTAPHRVRQRGRHAQQLRRRRHAVGHLADLRGDRGTGERDPPARPRLLLRGRPGRARRRTSTRAPFRCASWAASRTRPSPSTPTRTRSTRPRTPRARTACTSAGRRRPASAASAARCAGSRSPRAATRPARCRR